MNHRDFDAHAALVARPIDPDDIDRGPPAWLGVGLLGTFAAVIFAAVVGATYVLGAWNGSRDTRLLSEADRRAAIAACGDDAAFQDLRTGDVLCARGSMRATPKGL